jgi:xanthine/CO dehydrogenase XdhC/CoxF family maturation factor
MDRRETLRILQVIEDARRSGERVALATVVRVKGSAYRREGARLIVRQDGSHECLLSGGCLEPAVASAAARVIATGESVVASYDLEEDSVLGLGIGCSGIVDIRIERIEEDAISQEWRVVLANAEPAVLVTPLAGPSGRLVVRPDGTAIGALSDPRLGTQAVAAALRRTADPYPHSGADWIGGAEIFFEISERPLDLIIFGAGPDAAPLGRLAADLGFAVTVVDVREAYLTRERFADATLVPSHFSAFGRTVRIDARTSVVVMNHHLERDRECLRFAFASVAPYIGLLGPRSRYLKLLAALDAEGYAPEAARLASVRSPIGLALGAEAPEEIAVSVMGEILAIARGFDGGFLNGRDASLHRPATRSTARA